MIAPGQFTSRRQLDFRSKAIVSRVFENGGFMSIAGLFASLLVIISLFRIRIVFVFILITAHAHVVVHAGTVP